MVQTWRILKTLGPKFRKGGQIEATGAAVRSIAASRGLEVWEICCPVEVPPGESFVEKQERREARK